MSSNTLSSPSNQAMEPVGIGHGALTGHDAHVEPPPGQKHVLPPVDMYQPFTTREIVGAVAFFAFLIGTIAAACGLMAIIPWVLIKLFKLVGASQATASLWGNSLGTIVSIILIFVMILATLLTMGERKWSAFIQDRMGPNRARIGLPFIKNYSLAGLPHIIADSVKMLTKEEIVPAQSSKLIFHLSPALAFGPAFVLFGVIPMSPSFDFLGERITMQVAQVDMGLLYIFAIASIAVFGTTLAGWSSNNKFALLGGIRASAQMISYEVTLGLTLVGLMIVYSTLRLDVMTERQGGYLLGFLPNWGVFYQPLAIIAYFAAASAELKRAPFDLPEGESEIVGYFIEYSGMKFGLFMIAELVEVVVFAGLFTALFFGGWHIPYGEEWIGAHLGGGWLGFLQFVTFAAKTVFFCWLSLTVRWSFPRFRYDQIMDLGWKMLLPLSILNVMLTAFVTLAWGTDGAGILGLVELVALLAWIFGGLHIRRTGEETLLPVEGDGHGHDGHGDHHDHHAAAAHH